MWTVNIHPADELDLARDAVHNFKVAFVFRAIGEDVDGRVDDGPYWEALTAFAEEPSFYIANDIGRHVARRTRPDDPAEAKCVGGRHNRNLPQASAATARSRSLG
jgi:hypothetical protein